MSATVTRPMLRWSSVRDCARKAVYEATGAPARERYPDEDGYLQRGKEIGRGYVLRLVATERENGRHASVWIDSGPTYWCPPEYLASSRDEATHICEMKVPWELGVGHPDIYIPETRTVVEVLSSALATESYRRGKLLQAVGYAEHYEPAENVALVVVNPSNYMEERTIVVKTSRLYAELAAEMHERVGQVQAWADTGEIPARVCGRPGEARGHFCLHAEHCFEGWTEPPLEVLEADEDAIAAVVEYDTLTRLVAASAADSRVAEKRRKELKPILEALDLPEKLDVQIGPFKVKRTFTRRAATFDFDAAESAGMFDPAPVSDFFKPGAAYSTFKTVRVDVSGDEFGDEAPWTDEDLLG